jgi:hypothetical protein
MTVATYPFGNANYNQLSNGTWEFDCQHGPKECYLNTVFACIMARVDSQVEKYLPGVIFCKRIILPNMLHRSQSYDLNLQRQRCKNLHTKQTNNMARF